MPLTREEQKILDSIQIASENDPSKPEFPPQKPKFPATPTSQIQVEGFTNVWLKDESVNLTGTHCGKESDVFPVQEKYIDKAVEIAEDQNISCEPSGIAGLALMLQMRNKLPKNKKMLIVNTGKTRVNGN